MAKFCAMFSGSSGNCAVLSSGGVSVLIDAGVSATAIRKALDGIGSGIGEIAAILVTHEHSDHIRGLKTLLSKYKIPVYASAGTIAGILESVQVGDEHFRELAPGASTEIAGMSVSAFATSHDAKQSVGFRIHTPDGKRVAIATDLGYISDAVMAGIADCDVVMIESNHDVGMLQNGRYPYYLKRRILSKTGHLSNTDCAAVLPRLCTAGTKNFVLAHLSHDNNLPELALETAVAEMKLSGIDREYYHVEVAPRSGPEHILSV
jgi:phosphoribosyl 1,2-cyclic phosphodiesterase